MTYPIDADPLIDVGSSEVMRAAPDVTEFPDRTVGLGQRAVSGAVWISIETAVTQAMSLVVFTIMARFLSPHEFGLVSLTFVLLLSTKVVFLDQIPMAVVRKPSAAPREYSTVFWIGLAFGAAGFIALNLVSLVSARLFGAPGLGTIIRAMSVLLLAISATQTQERWLARHFAFKVLATRSIAGAFVGGAAGIGCAISGLGVWSLVVQQLVMSLTSMTLLWTKCPWRPRFEYDRQVAREIMSYMRGIVGGCVMYVLNQNCDVVLVGLFFGPSSVGIYGIGKRLTVALHMVAAAPINGVAMPSLAEVQEDAAQLRKVFLTATRIVLSVCGPVFVGAAALDRDIIRLAFGPHWVASVPVFGWLALGCLFLVLLEYHNNVFAIRNHPKWTTTIAIGYSVMALGLFFLMHRLHVGSIAMPFVLPYAVIFPISLILLMRLTGLSLGSWLRAALPPLVSALVMYVGVRALAGAWGHPLAIRLICGVLVGVVLYLASMAVLARETVAMVIRLADAKIRRRPIGVAGQVF